MRVLFLESHPMWVHGLPNGFRDAGHDVFITGRLVSESQINEIISRFSPDLIITMGWSEESAIEKQYWIRKAVKKANVTHVFWATEDPTCTYSYTLPYIERTHPDFVFTICQANIDLYRQKGIPAAYLDFGYHPNVHHPVQSKESYRCKIAVVANAYPHALEVYKDLERIQSIHTLISPFIKENIRVDFWGLNWEYMDNIVGCAIPKEWIHGYLPYTEGNSVYNSADIVIGLQNYSTQLTMRTYEILGSGGFLLTADTPEIRRLFVPGRDLIVTHSPEETLSLVNYYLNNPEERSNIRTNARMAVQEHHYKYRAERMIHILHERGFLNKREKPPYNSDRYIVKEGDTLRKISKKFRVSVESIRKTNQLETDTIYVNQPLTIPTSPTSNHYIVKAGDTLRKISKKFGVSVGWLRKTNQLKSDTIYVNQILKIKKRKKK